MKGKNHVPRNQQLKFLKDRVMALEAGLFRSQEIIVMYQNAFGEYLQKEENRIKRRMFFAKFNPLRRFKNAKAKTADNGDIEITVPVGK